MKTSIFLSISLLILGSGSIYAQQRGSTSRGTTVRTAQAQTVNASNRVSSQNNTISRTSGTAAEQGRSFPAQRTHNPPNKKTKVSKLLRGLELTDKQKRLTKQIFKDARENGTPVNEVLRQINSILRPEQSQKFVNKIKRINNQNKPKPKKLKKVLRKVELSDNQWAKVNRIFKNARKNDVPFNEVLRQINSILRPEQSREFKHLLKRIYQNQPGDGSPNTDAS